MTGGQTATERWARVHGSPGEHPRLRGLMQLVLPLVGTVAVAAYVLGATLRWPALSPAVGGLILLLLAAAFWGAVALSRRRLAAFIKGARGEEAVARLLAMLPEGYDVFHGLTVGGQGAGADVDHVVVGPTGVFAIETKNWEGPIEVVDGRVRYGGREPDRPPLAQVSQAADALRAVLRGDDGTPVTVQPVLCFLGDAQPVRVSGAGGVLICGARQLRDVVLEPAEAELPATVRVRVAAGLRPLLG